MPSDANPVDALRHQLDLEQSSISPVGKWILAILASLPTILPWPLGKVVAGLKDQLASDSAEKIRIMVETVADEVRKHDAEIHKIKVSLSQQQTARREQAAKDLLLDAVRKSTNTRSIERIKRIGLILANGLLSQAPLDEDQIEEMMRVAVDVGNDEVRYLRELGRIEGTHVPEVGLILGGHLKTGHTWPLQNRPTELNQNKSSYNPEMAVSASIFRSPA